MARPMNQVVFEPLGHEKSWTLPVYEKFGGYSAWRRILAEKVPPEKVIEDKRDKLEALERSITATLETRAMDERHLALVREASRQSVAAFVKHWLMKEDHWREDRFTSIVVVFPDETDAASVEEWAPETYQPTLRFAEP